MFRINHLNGFGVAQRAVVIDITAGVAQADANLFTLAGSPADPVYIRLTVALTAWLYATTTGVYALTVPASFAAGSTIELVFLGSVVGCGGVGGNGASKVGAGLGVVYTPPTGGLAGGPAIFVGYPTRIDNQGLIGGGGGGGGGGAAAGGDLGGGNESGVGGSGGGAGQTYQVIGGGAAGVGAGAPFSANGNPGGSAGLGTQGSGGGAGYVFNGFDNFGGVGGNGGTWGTAGATGGVGGPTYGGAAGGGAAGYSVVGNALVTWVNVGTRLGPVA